MKAMVKIVCLILSINLYSADNNQKKEMISFWDRTFKDLKCFILNRSTLCNAAEEGRIDIVESYIRSGSNIHEFGFSGRTPLIEAIYNEKIDVVKLLIKAHVNVNQPDESGTYPIIAAAIKNSEAMSVLLIKSGAQINQKNKYGNTPLMFAASTGNKNLVDLFIRIGAAVNARNDDGHSALMIAAEAGYTEIVSLLINSRANINFRAYKTLETALVLATGRGKASSVKLLIEAGADTSFTDSQSGNLLFIALHRANRKTVQTILKSKKLTIDFNKKITAPDDQTFKVNALGFATHTNKPLSLKLLLVDRRIDRSDFSKTNPKPPTSRNAHIHLILSNCFQGLQKNLYEMIKNCNYAQFVNCLKKVKDLRLYDNNWNTPLHTALLAVMQAKDDTARTEAIKIIGLILSFSDNLLFEENKDGVKPMDIIVQRPYLMRLLCDCGNKKSNAQSVVISNNGKYVAS